MARKKKSQDGDKGRTLYRAKSGCFPRVSGVFVAVMALSIFLVFAIPVSGQPVQPYDTPGFIAGTPIPVRQCEDGARCSGGADCMNGICVNLCNPTSPFCACDCILSGPEPEFPWVVVVGGLAAVAAAAAIISRILKNKPKKKGEPPAEIYILQLSKDNLVVSPKKNDSFTATAWKVTEVGGMSPAPSASIQATHPAHVTGLLVTPPSGKGSLMSVVSLNNYAGPESLILTITASGGGGKISADIRVKIESEAEIEFD